jgi:undecaprenyl diphosphate synthase
VSPDASASAEFFSEAPPDLLGAVDALRVPRHVAIIMDGNGRWAERKGLPRLAGHRAGAQAVREAISASIELGIEYLTIYSFSSENWNRPLDEVKGLMSLFVEVLERELVNLERMHVRVRVIGDMAGVPDRTRQAFERCVERTAAQEGLTLVVALNYGGRADILQAVGLLAAECRDGLIDATRIDEELFSSKLSTEGIPDPDLVIRTSGEMRVSNFLLWEIAYSELWVTDVLWPDFDRTTLLEAVVDYQSRTRRFGGR